MQRHEARQKQAKAEQIALSNKVKQMGLKPPTHEEMKIALGNTWVKIANISSGPIGPFNEWLSPEFKKQQDNLIRINTLIVNKPCYLVAPGKYATNITYSHNMKGSGSRRGTLYFFVSDNAQWLAELKAFPGVH
jgi:hypothetical protein